MKTKTSVTLDSTKLKGIAAHAGDFHSRSEFVEAAVDHFIKHLEHQRVEQKDLEILNRRAKALTKEAEDVLSFQVAL